MAKARWWMCEGCKSLNDMPANKCYKCRTSRPASPTLLDDQYGQVGGKPRVAVSVDLSRVQELAARDPVESQKGSGVFEAFTAQDDLPIESARTAEAPRSGPPPMREPVKRGISELGGQDWRLGLPPLPPPMSPGPPPVKPPGPPQAGPRAPEPPAYGSPRGVPLPPGMMRPPLPPPSVPPPAGPPLIRPPLPPGAPPYAGAPASPPSPPRGGSPGMPPMPSGPHPAGPMRPPPGVPMPPGTPMPPGVPPTPPGMAAQPPRAVPWSPPASMTPPPSAPPLGEEDGESG